MADLKGLLEICKRHNRVIKELAEDIERSDKKHDKRRKERIRVNAR